MNEVQENGWYWCPKCEDFTEILASNAHWQHTCFDCGCVLEKQEAPVTDRTNVITLRMQEELFLGTYWRDVYVPRGSGPKQLAAMIKELARELRDAGKTDLQFEQDPALGWKPIDVSELLVEGE